MREASFHIHSHTNGKNDNLHPLFKAMILSEARKSRVIKF